MRIEPLCVHFGVCGGCHYQHISYTRQLEFKRQILTEQLERLGGLQNPPVRPALPAHQEYGYRNNIQFHLSPAGRLAYQAAGAGNLVEISMCLLPEHSLSEVWPALDFKPGAPIARVGLRSGAGDEVLLESGRQPAGGAGLRNLPAGLCSLHQPGRAGSAGWK